jgi:hypothetical protein
MSLYMIQFVYTPEAKAALAREPEDRSVVFGQRDRTTDRGVVDLPPPVIRG